MQEEGRNTRRTPTVNWPSCLGGSFYNLIDKFGLRKNNLLLQWLGRFPSRAKKIDVISRFLSSNYENISNTTMICVIGSQ